jgi:hypothetical protein
LPLGVAAIPTIGWFSFTAPVDPRNGASPKLKIPPSEATSQYPDDTCRGPPWEAKEGAADRPASARAVATSKTAMRRERAGRGRIKEEEERSSTNPSL